MTDHNEERDTDETAIASKAFLDGIAELMQRHQIQPGLACSLFGFFARTVIQYEVEELGGEYNGLIFGALQAFTTGLGVKGGFVEMKGEMGAQLKAQVDLQNSDTPLQ